MFFFLKKCPLKNVVALYCVVYGKSVLFGCMSTCLECKSLYCHPQACWSHIFYSNTFFHMLEVQLIAACFCWQVFTLWSIASILLDLKKEPWVYKHITNTYYTLTHRNPSMDIVLVSEWLHILGICDQKCMWCLLWKVEFLLGNIQNQNCAVLKTSPHLFCHQRRLWYTVYESREFPQDPQFSHLHSLWKSFLFVSQGTCGIAPHCTVWLFSLTFL